jgi:hypothetical protein
MVVLFALGIFVWLFGNRLWLLGAGAGALLGFGLLRLFPSLANETAGLLITLGLIVLFGVLGFIGKAVVKIFALIVGFFIGGGLALSLLDLLGVYQGFFDWIAALAAGAIVALIFARSINLGLVIFASLVGSMLMVRSAMEVLPALLVGSVGPVLVALLTVIGIFYHYRKHKPTQNQPAESK